MACAFGVPWWW